MTHNLATSRIGYLRPVRPIEAYSCQPSARQQPATIISTNRLASSDRGLHVNVNAPEPDPNPDYPLPRRHRPCSTPRRSRPMPIRRLCARGPGSYWSSQPVSDPPRASTLLIGRTSAILRTLCPAHAGASDARSAPPSVASRPRPQPHPHPLLRLPRSRLSFVARRSVSGRTSVLSSRVGRAVGRRRGRWSCPAAYSVLVASGEPV